MSKLNLFFFYLLVSETIRGGGEVELHDALELGLIAAVLKGCVVVVTAEHVGLVVRKSRTVKAEMIASFVVRVRFTDSEVCRKSCSKKENIKIRLKMFEISLNLNLK